MSVEHAAQAFNASTFQQMLDRLAQWRQGLISDSELLLNVQLHPHQLTAILNLHRLPQRAYLKVSLIDIEPDWERMLALAEHAGEDVRSSQQAPDDLSVPADPAPRDGDLPLREFVKYEDALAQADTAFEITQADAPESG